MLNKFRIYYERRYEGTKARRYILIIIISSSNILLAIMACKTAHSPDYREPKSRGLFLPCIYMYHACVVNIFGRSCLRVQDPFRPSTSL